LVCSFRIEVQKKDFFLESIWCRFSRSWSEASEGIKFIMVFSRFCCAVLGGGVAAPGKQKAAMVGRRGVLRDIGNIGNVRVAEG
jgi:hypothetical protein